MYPVGQIQLSGPPPTEPDPVGVVENARSFHRPAQPVRGREKSRGAAGTRPPKGSRRSGLRVRVLTLTPSSSRRPGHVPAGVAGGSGYYGRIGMGQGQSLLN